MSAELIVCVPVLARPERAQLLVDSLDYGSKTGPRLLFVCSPEDTEEITACRKTGADVLLASWNPGRADWARKLELAREKSDEPYLLLAADDLRFHPGWDKHLLNAFARYDVGVVGTRDGGNPNVERGIHSTHPAVCRGYIDRYGTIDDKSLMLHQGYDHQYADNELVETAMSRGCWYFERRAYVEHLHPAWNKATIDPTYRKAYRAAQADYRLFRRRRRLWMGNRRGVLRLT